MSFDAVIPRLLLCLKAQLSSTDKTYQRWVALHYPIYTCLLIQQRLRVLGIVVAVYTAETQLTPSKERVARLIEWVNKTPFRVVDEHLAIEMFNRLHYDIPITQPIVTTCPRLCLKLRYVLVSPDIVGI